MIIDLRKYIADEKPYWTELEEMLDAMDKEPGHQMDLDRVKRFHYLYQKVSADLARIMTFSAEPTIRRYLESLVARAYGEIYETRRGRHRLKIKHWFFQTFPQTFRRHFRVFLVVLAVTLAGTAFGGFAITADNEAKEAFFGSVFSHLQQTPSERVAKEEAAVEDRMAGRKTSFSAYLMTHNIKVSIFVFALGMTFGIGSIILLFYNGVVLGAVAVEYIMGGETVFLCGWLLPHGAIEIPAILLAGQAGLVLANALIGWGKPLSPAERLRAVTADVTTLIFGVSIMLVWAGIVESFLSQYHEPVIPYSLKIAFGVVELILLTVYLSRCGRKQLERRSR